MVEGADDKILATTIARYRRVDLFASKNWATWKSINVAKLLFQVLTEREERNSMAIASNDSFSGGIKTFTDARLCAVI
jgi:hypothetical protein